MEHFSDKHAYLILAHADDLSFRTLIKMLDHPNNDIYLHMDKKQKNFQVDEIKKALKHSKIHLTPRIKIGWGGYNLIKAELLLLKTSIKHDHYAYYHIISGQDLPIKTQAYIHNFFKKNNGKEFINFQDNVFRDIDRVKYYYPFQEILGRSTSLSSKILNFSTITFQKIFHINRNKDQRFQKGANWVSITDDLAQYVVNHEKWIYKTFRWSKCCDEVFIQTIVDDSNYKNHLYHTKYDDSPISNMRLIDWKRGGPYIFRINDLEEIKKSECLFARKFDPTVDKEIITVISNLYS